MIITLASDRSGIGILKSDSGWSLVELAVVVGIVAIVGTFAVIKVMNDRESDVSSAVAQMFIGDLALAQNLAMSSNKAVVFMFTAGTDDGGENEDDEGGDGEGCGDPTHDHTCVGRGHGHNEDVRGEGRNGRGRGHGYGYGHAHHGCGEGCGGGTSGGYGLQFADGSEIPYPLAASVTNISSPVTLNPTADSFRFDSVGRLIIDNYTWGTNQTSLILVRINGRVGIRVTRETGSASVVKL